MSVTCHRSANPTGTRIFLTFDDGPIPGFTLDVLNVLKKHQAKATFFVVAEKAVANPDIIQKIIEHGHSIGNHSLNHSFRPFFSGRKTMVQWIETAEKKLYDLTNAASVGWRSPAGIQTPPLHYALKKLNIPMIHWNVRYYDTVRRWTWKAAEDSIPQIKPGSIVLLHDKQKPENEKIFLETLEKFIPALKQRGLNLDRLLRTDFLASDQD
jgi:peptidoglycan/xylan/chitin deacetylase (PgdA/CDA1 family)